ncbi:MAG: hypothetical protein R6W31_20570 [Bacteroidales bacterium]
MHTRIAHPVEAGVSIPNFEKYIRKFQEKHRDTIYSTFVYPEQALPDLFPWSPNIELPNILALDSITVQGGSYSFAAITPLNSSLTIKFISVNSNNSYTISALLGWVFTNDYPEGFTVTSQRRNELMSMLLYLSNTGSAVIEFYKDISEIPTFVKKIKWNDVMVP